jgi:hypothetical protein
MQQVGVRVAGALVSLTLWGATNMSVRTQNRPYPVETPVRPPKAAIPDQFNHKTVGVTVAVSFALMAALAAVVVLSSLLIVPPAKPAVIVQPTAVPTAPSTPFDPSVGAPLPHNRLVLFYGIAYSGIDHNGPASIHPFTFLPQLQQLGQQWTMADPTHPAKLGLDLVVNVADSCQEYVVETCEHDVQKSILDSYISFCQEHGLFLFLDFQFGRATVQSVVTSYLPYLERYPFVEMALDTEFHFYTPNYGIPSFDPGYMKASDVNWVIGQLAQIPTEYHVPRKVLLLHEWFDGAISDVQTVKASPKVSIVLHSDGFGNPHDKIFKYYLLFLQEALKYGGAQYGGFKLFNLYADCPFPQQPGCSGDIPQWTPQDLLHPQLLDSDPADSQMVAAMAANVPLLVSYE